MLMRAYLFANLILGFVFVYRTLMSAGHNKVIEQKALTKIGTGYIAYVIFVFCMWDITWSMIPVTVYLPILVGWPCMSGIRQWRERRVKKMFLVFLDSVILNMRSGTGFRQSVREAARLQQDKFFHRKVLDILDVVVFSQHKESLPANDFVRFVIEEFRRVDREPYQGLKRLVNMRKKLRTESDFRRRSGQILLQIRLQSAVLTGLYVALVMFVAWEYGVREYAWLFWFSGSLFLLGGAGVFALGRRMTWKV